MILQSVLKQPMNKMVNEAVRDFIEKRTAEVEVDLRGVADRLRAYQQSDPGFLRAIARFSRAEAAHGAGDPVEGKVVRAPKPGPALSRVRELLRG